MRWLSWGFWLFNISGLLWVFILIPTQFHQTKLARTFENGSEIPMTYWKLGGNGISGGYRYITTAD